MKTKDTKTRRFEMRLTDEEYKLLQMSSDYVRRSPTQFVRLLLRSAFTEMRMIIDKEEVQNENVKANSNDKL